MKFPFVLRSQYDDAMKVITQSVKLCIDKITKNVKLVDYG